MLSRRLPASAETGRQSERQSCRSLQCIMLGTGLYPDTGPVYGMRSIQSQQISLHRPGYASMDWRHIVQHYSCSVSPVTHSVLYFSSFCDRLSALCRYDNGRLRSTVQPSIVSAARFIRSLNAAMTNAHSVDEKTSPHLYQGKVGSTAKHVGALLLYPPRGQMARDPAQKYTSSL